MSDTTTATPNLTETRDGTTVSVTHRFPWSIEERIIMVGAAALGITVGVTVGGLFPLLGWSCLGLAVAAYLFHVGKSRKNKSAVTVTISGSKVKVHSDGFVGRSQVDTKTVVSVTDRRRGSYDCFVLAGDGGGAFVPVLCAAHPAVRDVVTGVLAQVKSVSADARDLYASIGVDVPDLKSR